MALRRQLFSFLDSAHDSRLAVICAFDDAGENPADSSVFRLLQASHDSLLHHTDKLLVAQFAVPVVVEEGEDLRVEIIIFCPERVPSGPSYHIDEMI